MLRLTPRVASGHFAILPATQESGKLDFRVEHPQFVSSGTAHDFSMSIKDLRTDDARIVLKTGFTLEGTVTDERGKPFKFADVIFWSDVEGRQADAKTDPLGHFRFQNLARACSRSSSRRLALPPA